MFGMYLKFIYPAIFLICDRQLTMSCGLRSKGIHVLKLCRYSNRDLNLRKKAIPLSLSSSLCQRLRAHHRRFHCLPSGAGHDAPSSASVPPFPPRGDRELRPTLRPHGCRELRTYLPSGAGRDAPSTASPPPCPPCGYRELFPYPASSSGMRRPTPLLTPVSLPLASGQARQRRRVPRIHQPHAHWRIYCTGFLLPDPAGHVTPARTPRSGGFGQVRHARSTPFSTSLATGNSSSPSSRFCSIYLIIFSCLFLP